MKEDQDWYKPVFITIQLSSEINKLLSESATRSHRKKLQEARLRLEDHLIRFHAISKRGSAISDKYENETNFLFINKDKKIVG